MEPSQIQIEDLLLKWEKYHPSSKEQNDEKPWYNQPVSECNIVNPRKSRMKAIRKANQDLPINSITFQRRFRVNPPILDINIENYEAHQCSKCLNTISYIPLPAHSTFKGQLRNIWDFVYSKKESTLWFCIGLIKRVLMSAGYQSKDEMMLKHVKSAPTIVVHDSPDGYLSSLLVYIFYTFLGRMPYAVIREDAIYSNVIKYFLKKMGFIFIQDYNDSNQITNTTVDLIELLKTDHHILVPFQEDSRSSCNLLFNLFDEIRNNEELKGTSLTTVSLSVEKDLSLGEGTSLTKLISQLISYPKSLRSLAQFNVSRGLDLISLLHLAKELNQQDLADEENGLIKRHIAFDLLETGAIFPTHLLSFLFITKMRRNVSFEELFLAVEWLIKELHGVDRFLGFSGKVEDIAMHGMKLLESDGVIQIQREDLIVKPNLSDLQCLDKLYLQSKRVIQVLMMEAIVGTSIIACSGGRKELSQGTGSNIQCRGDNVLEKADFLGEILYFLFDYSCSFNQIKDDLGESIERMVTKDILQTSSDIYENQSHQKLVHSIGLSSEWDDQDNHSGDVESLVFYRVSTDPELLEYLDTLHSCVKPFIDLVLTIACIIRENFGEGKKFSASSIKDVLTKRFSDGFFLYGEMITLNLISRVFEYLFEKVIIDDVDDEYVLSESFFPGNGELEHFVQDLSLCR